jgi:uncharacterized protein (DUF58 family)
MLTRQGWLVAALAVATLIGGRLLGLTELYVLGAGLGALVLFAAVWVGSARVQLRVERRLRPQRVHAGREARVDIAVTNLTGRRSRILRLHDPVSSTPGATAEVGPIGAGATGRLAYRLPTDRRGITVVGPLTATVSDPFGLAEVALIAASIDELTVYPRVEQVVPVPVTLGHDPHGGAEDPPGLGRVGEDFYALRAYSVGDDLRRVHWPTTARRGELMVRQDELPWQGRATVLVDLRRDHFDEDSFEQALSVVASVVSAERGRRDLLRLVTTDGGDSGFGAGNAHVEALLEYLATAEPTNRGTLQGSVTSLRRVTHSGALVVVVGNATHEDLAAARSLHGSYASVTVVDVRTDPASTPPATGDGVVVLRAGEAFAPRWNDWIATRRLVRR